MNELGVFAKHWTPGQVKTRLAAAIGPEKAAQVYLACLRTTLSRFADAGEIRTLAYTPAERRDDFANLASQDWRIEPQFDVDTQASGLRPPASSLLGKRIHAYLTGALDRGANRVVLIGSDSPTLPRRLLDEALARLADAPVVLGPTEDGGYYLIGLAGLVPPIFEGVSWSTAEVWNQTVARLESNAVKFATLEPWYDVDELADLNRLLGDLKQAGDSCHWFAALREELERLEVGGMVGRGDGAMGRWGEKPVR